MIKLTYQLDEPYWITAEISDGVSSLKMYPSQIGGNIGSLAADLVALHKYSHKAICRWEDEPGEWRWVLESEGDNLRITILWFNQSHSYLSDEKGEVLFATECSLFKFANQVRTQLRDLLVELGAEEYKRRARGEFPFRYYEALNEIVRGEEARRKAERKAGQ